MPFRMGDDGVMVVVPLLSVIIFVCFSWHSLTEFSKSLRRDRNQSTVRLSTVNEFGCSLLPSVSLSSNNV